MQPPIPDLIAIATALPASLAVPHSDERNALAAALETAGRAYASAILLNTGLVAGELPPTASLGAAVRSRLHAADGALAAVVPTPERLRAWSRAAWSEHALAVEALRSQRAWGGVPRPSPAVWAPLKIPVVAAALAAGRHDAIEPALRRFDRTAAAAAGPVPAGAGAPRAGTDEASADPDRAAWRARAYLEADPELREAWEEYRWRFMGAPLLRARVFAMGLIHENLCHSGAPSGDGVCRLFDDYAASGFHYYDQPSAQPPDADTLGLMLRLVAFSPHPDRHRRLLQEPLSWLEANLATDGSMPTFLPRGVGAGVQYLPAMTGNRCTAVQAGLLTGMLEAGVGGEAFVRRVLPATLERFAEEGRASVVHYDSPCAAWIVLELLAALERTGGALVAEGLADAAGTRAAALLRERNRVGLQGPDDAAFLLLGSRHRRAGLSSDPSWTSALVRSQRADGSWSASPLYLLPSRGNLVTCYASRSVSTSFCLRALHVRGAAAGRSAST